MNTVSYLLGVPVDYYVGFGMNVVKEVVNAMGGVDYDVDISFTLNGRETVEGYQHMDGQQVLDYCRWRKGGRGDIDRIDRQQRIPGSPSLSRCSRPTRSRTSPTSTPRCRRTSTRTWIRSRSRPWPGSPRTCPWTTSPATPCRATAQYVGSTSYYIVYQNEKNEMVQEIFGVEARL